jgi:hypothetical protein
MQPLDLRDGFLFGFHADLLGYDLLGLHYQTLRYRALLGHAGFTMRRVAVLAIARHRWICSTPQGIALTCAALQDIAGFTMLDGGQRC